MWNAICLFALWLTPVSVNSVLIYSEVLKASKKQLNVIAAIRMRLPIDKNLN